MLKLVTWLAFCFTCCIAGQFPRPDVVSIVSFMDQEHGMADMAGDDDLYVSSSKATVRTDIKGPFGDSNTCWGVSEEGDSLCGYHPIPVSRTIVFYFYTPATDHLGPIFKRATYFLLNYNKTNLEFKGMNMDWTVNEISVVENFLVPNAWNFIALTDDGIKLKMYNEEGSLLRTLPSFTKYQAEDASFETLGYYFDVVSGRFYMKKTDAFACYYDYSAVLTGEEISQIPSTCKNTVIPIYFPRPEVVSIVSFMNEEYGVADMAGEDDVYVVSSKATVRTDITGPFGDSNSCWGITEEGDSMCGYHPIPLSRTIAFYFYTPADERLGPIFKRASYFFLNYYYTHLEFKGMSSTWDIESKQVVYNFLNRNAWNFIAFTDDGSNLRVYNDGGYLYDTLPSFLKYQADYSFQTLGYYYDASAGSVYMKKTDAFGCFYDYNAVLTGEEISKIPSSCKHNAIPQTDTTSTTTNLPLPFPKPEDVSVVSFMDEEYGLADMAGEDDVYYISSNAIVRTDITGPFGDSNTCWGLSEEGDWLCSIHPVPLSRTVAFYFYTPATDHLGPIFKRASYFLLNYNQTNLEFKGMNMDWTLNEKSVVENFLVPNAWNFIAFTDDGIKLKMYNEEGALLYTLPSFAKYQAEDASFQTIGYYFDVVSREVYMKKSDAFACYYDYSAVLTGEEISQIPTTCQYKVVPPAVTTPTTTSSTETPCCDTGIWPQQDHLVGLWPLSVFFEASDISGNQLEPTEPAQVDRFTTGPYGNPYTAVVATKAYLSLLEIESSKLAPSDGSFTVAMWFSPQSHSQSGGLFQYLDHSGTNRAMQFRYNGSNIDISANGSLIGNFKMVQSDDRWTFIAVSLENNEKLTVYGDQGIFGQIEKCSACASSMEFNTGGMELGYSSYFGEYIRIGDTISCFSMYNTMLTDLELRQVKDGCRIVNSVALSGQPRLPLSPIPDVSNPLQPKIPSNGQFPWLGSLEYKRQHICSATIINSLWVLTSATCVVDDQSVFMYKFVAATYDLDVSYEHQQEREIDIIALSGNSPNDLALLKLLEPLDMGSNYINDAYISRGGEKYANWLKEQLFVGWGLNGREDLDSPTLPRYVVGEVLTEAECKASWPEDYDSEVDYCFKSEIDDQNVPCHGDEGSPLLLQTDGDVDAGMGERLLQVGVYRLRDANCTKLKPGLFTRTAPFAEWIATVIDHV